MLTEFKLAITAAILLVVFFVAFAVYVNQHPRGEDAAAGVLALLCIISFAIALVSLILGIWQL